MSLILDAFRNGGWGMYPTSLLGAWALGRAMQAVVLERAQLWPSVRALQGATLAAGLLGFVTGIIRATQFIQEVPIENQVGIFLTGLGESASNVALALLLWVLTQLVMAVGSPRMSGVSS